VHKPLKQFKSSLNL